MRYVIPVVLIVTLLVATIKKISVYDSFVTGAKESVKLTLSVLPYLVSIFVMVEILSVSGLSEKICHFLAPSFSFLGIPTEVIELVLLRPLSGSGSLVLTEKILLSYGADSYIARCASVISGCSDTVFYIVAVYLSKSKDKKTYGAIPIALFANFCGSIFSCLICGIL